MGSDDGRRPRDLAAPGGNLAISWPAREMLVTACARDAGGGCSRAAGGGRRVSSWLRPARKRLAAAGARAPVGGHPPGELLAADALLASYWRRPASWRAPGSRRLRARRNRDPIAFHKDKIAFYLGI
jgi:hypothetical protein